MRFNENNTPDVLHIRTAEPSDGAELAVLAELDSRRAPTGDVLVAEVEGEFWAAVSMDDDQAIADPFRPTADIVTLLRERARQLRTAA
jgi:hypothetical protein